MNYVKYILAVLVLLALALGLSVVMLYLLYLALILSLFYKGVMLLVIGATIAGIFTWAALKVFTRRKVYTVKEGVKYVDEN